MFSTIKAKILFAVSFVMVMTTLVNIFFTHRDAGDAMFTTQEGSALNILHSLNLIIDGDYRTLLTEKRTMTLSKRNQLKNTAQVIESVFHSFARKNSGNATRGVEQALAWLKTAPLTGTDYYIIDNRSKVIATSNSKMTTDFYRTLTDIKQRDIAREMRFDNLDSRGDFAAFNTDGRAYASVMAYFKPFEPWQLTLGISVDVSQIQALAEKQRAQSLSSLVDYTRGLQIADTGFVYLFDQTGTHLVAPPEPRSNALKTQVNQLTGNLIMDDIRKNTATDFSRFLYLPETTQGETSSKMIVYCEFFKPFKWYISVIVPMKEIKLPAQRLVIRQSLIISFVFMAGLAAIVFVVGHIAGPLLRLSSYARQIPQIDFSKPLEETTPIDDLPGKYNDEVGALATSFILMRHELSRNIQDLINVTAARQRIESELGIAREIQLGMVPKTFPDRLSFPGLDLYATLQPAKEVGGDLYDFFQLDDDHLVFTLGDVSDKGVPAALFMVVTRTLIRVFSGQKRSPGEMMTRINNVLSSDNPRSMFVTLVVGILNLQTGKILYANGGHNPPIIVSEKETRFVDDKKEPLVGAMPGMIYSDRELTLGNKEGFLLYTDGVNEAMDENGEQFSNERLIEQVCADKALAPEQVIHHLIDSIKKHAQKAPQSDDIAMLMIKFNYNSGTSISS